MSPRRSQRYAAGERSMLAAALFGAAALLASRSGHADQVWPHVAMAVAVLSQAGLALVARVDKAGRVEVRASDRPIWVNGVVGTVLAGGGAGRAVARRGRVGRGLVRGTRRGGGPARGGTAGAGRAAAEAARSAAALTLSSATRWATPTRW